MATHGPWHVKDHGGTEDSRKPMEIRGPNDESIATLFPGGVGMDETRRNAELIVKLVNASKEAS